MSRLTSTVLAASVAAASIAAVVYCLPADDPQRDTPRRVAKAALPTPPSCHFEVGETAAFSFESTTRDVRVEDDAADKLEGTLSWEVVDQRSHDRWRLRAALSDVSLTQILTPPNERAEGALNDPFFVEVDDSCRFVGFGFNAQWDARRRQLVQSALVTHEFVVPASPRETRWSASQFDGLGDFEARYELARGTDSETRVRRHKAAYEGAAEAAAFGISVAVVGSKATATFDRTAPHWLMASSGLERVQIRMQGEIAADLLQKFTLVRDDDLFVPVPAMDPQNADFRNAFDLEIEHDAAVDARLAQVSYDETLAAFLDRFADFEADPSYAAARELAAWLKAHPEGAAQLAASLRNGEVDRAARPALFLGLELSGTDAAREVLADLLVDARMAPVDRARAASALSDIGEPTQGTAELLLAQVQGDGDAMVANVSVLGLGSMAKRSGDEALRTYVREALDEELASAADEGAAHVVLDAMGNTGDPAFTDELTAHLGAESATTRKHAAEALGRLGSDESGPRLLEQLDAETDPAVRASIVGAYHGPPTADAIALMSDKLANSPSTTERAALIAWLGSAARSEPEAQDQLVAHIHRETDTRLMRQIGSFVPAAALR